MVHHTMPCPLCILAQVTVTFSFATQKHFFSGSVILNSFGLGRASFPNLVKCWKYERTECTDLQTCDKI